MTDETIILDVAARAEELRKSAEEVKDPAVRATLLKLAAMWKRLAGLQPDLAKFGFDEETRH